ncbi:MAG: ABC transporter permease [Christensenellaceae bacterium]|nr:ABC transporter permease [Christensenellaceae bacterium]
MRNWKLVFEYELKTLLSKKSTIIPTIIIALIVFGVFNIPRFVGLFSSGDTAKEYKPMQEIVEDVGYVFEDSETGEKVKAALQLPDENIYKSRDELVNSISDGKNELGFVVLAPTKFESIWQDRDIENMAETTFSNLLQGINAGTMLAEKGISLEEVNAIQNIQVEYTTTIMGKDTSINLLIAFLLLFVVYMIVILYGNVTATLIAREKDSRTMELLITSTKSTSLILGKVSASAVSAILQVAVIGLAGYLGFMLNKDLLPEFIIMALSGTLTKQYIITYIYFSIVGYTLYLFLYASLGSMVSKVEDVSSATAPVVFLFIIGYIVSSFSMSAPNSNLVMIVSLIPFTSVMLMPFRTAIATVPTWQYLLSGGLLLVTTILLAFLSIKIYRQGTLNYGNKRGIVHAIKAAFNKE